MPNPATQRMIDMMAERAVIDETRSESQRLEQQERLDRVRDADEYRESRMNDVDRWGDAYARWAT